MITAEAIITGRNAPPERTGPEISQKLSVPRSILTRLMARHPDIVTCDFESNTEKKLYANYHYLGLFTKCALREGRRLLNTIQEQYCVNF
jgi:predicted hydrolase (HD superfamily)